jgi:hypothetical protein
MPKVTLPMPHGGQQQVIDGAKRFNVLCCGRRWGKTGTLDVWSLDSPDSGRGRAYACVVKLRGF